MADVHLEDKIADGTVVGGGKTVSTNASGNVNIGTATWTDVLSLVLPAGNVWNVRADAHFLIGQTVGWCRVRIVDGSAVVKGLGSEYANNAAKECQRHCEAASVAGGQTVKLQAFSDASPGTNLVTQLDGYAEAGAIATKIIASPA